MLLAQSRLSCDATEKFDGVIVMNWNNVFDLTLILTLPSNPVAEVHYPVNNSFSGVFIA